MSSNLTRSTKTFSSLYDQFKHKKQYLDNVSPATVNGYGWAWKAFQRVFESTGLITKIEIVSRIAEMRQAGMTPVTIDTYPKKTGA